LVTYLNLLKLNLLRYIIAAHHGDGNGKHRDDVDDCRWWQTGSQCKGDQSHQW